MDKYDVAIIVGSDSDFEIAKHVSLTLLDYGIHYSYTVLSAHRDPDELKKHIKQSEEDGVKVFIAAAGMAAALPGVVASHTNKPVIGVPLSGSPLCGLDSLLSIVQMPRGVPVATMSLDKHGAINAAIFASQILALLVDKEAS